MPARALILRHHDMLAGFCSLLLAVSACSAGAGAPSSSGRGGGAGNGAGGSQAGSASSSGGVAGTSVSGGSAGSDVPGAGGTTGGTTGGGGNGAGAEAGTSAGGSDGVAGSGGGGSVGACPSNAIFCTGFEESGIPAGMSYQPAYKAADWSNHMAIQSSVTNSGSSALEVKNTGEYWAMLSLPVATSTFWVRVYMRSSEDWGQEGHNSFLMAMTGNGDFNGGDNVEVSEQFCQPVFNLHDDVVVSTGGTPACGTGVGPLAKNTWRCVEALFDGAAGTYQVYADNQLILDKTGWNQLAFATFSIGYVNFHGPQRTMWYDDLAVAPARVGCP
jgi:hypothetical protein